MLRVQKKLECLLTVVDPEVTHSGLPLTLMSVRNVRRPVDHYAPGDGQTDVGVLIHNDKGPAHRLQ